MWPRSNSTNPLVFGRSWVVQHEAMEFFCPSKEVAFAAWNDEFDPETGFPRATATGKSDA